MTDPLQNTSLTFRYIFSFEKDQKKEFNINLDESTLDLQSPSLGDLPEWTKLDFYPCENCPLLEKVSHCPVAVNLSAIVEEFKAVVSYENATISVETAERTYSKKTSVQKGLSSIIGIVMVTSNCPVMDELRPMTRYHLPFATTEETLFRAVSYYLTRQYFVMMEGGRPDWKLENLDEIYKKVSVVNVGISKRVSQASQKDANVNAIVILHSFGDSITFHIENGLREIRYLFEKYL